LNAGRQDVWLLAESCDGPEDSTCRPLETDDDKEKDEEQEDEGGKGDYNGHFGHEETAQALVCIH
jgi:hypothetical protein